MSLREQLKMHAAAEPNVPNPFHAVKSHDMALCVEATGGEVWVLPWHNLVVGRHEAGEHDRLVLTFVAHEVVIRGLNLNRLIPEIANQRVDWLRAAPGKYLKATGGEPSIDQICVRPLAVPVVAE